MGQKETRILVLLFTDMMPLWALALESLHSCMSYFCLPQWGSHCRLAAINPVAKLLFGLLKWISQRSESMFAVLLVGIKVLLMCKTLLSSSSRSRWFCYSLFCMCGWMLDRKHVQVHKTRAGNSACSDQWQLVDTWEGGISRGPSHEIFKPTLIEVLALSWDFVQALPVSAALPCRCSQ